MSETTKERLTVNLPPELIERARNAVYWTPGDSGGLPLGVFHSMMKSGMLTRVFQTDLDFMNLTDRLSS